MPIRSVRPLRRIELCASTRRVITTYVNARDGTKSGGKSRSPKSRNEIYEPLLERVTLSQFFAALRHHYHHHQHNRDQHRRCTPSYCREFYTHKLSGLFSEAKTPANKAHSDHFFVFPRIFTIPRFLSPKTTQKTLSCPKKHLQHHFRYANRINLQKPIENVSPIFASCLRGQRAIK